ncbi:MAG TPA: head GIN domain-containing protein [Victivallales bacterium]|nr:head GIN domain-containing protein [Victivallales bacterium]
MNKHTKLALILSIMGLTALLAGCAGIHGNGTPSTDKRLLSNFNAINLQGGYEVYIHINKNTQSHITISGDDNILPLITSNVEDNTLYIKKTKYIDKNLTLVLNIYTKNLESLTINGAGKINVPNLNNKQFYLDISGATSVTLSGTTNSLIITSSGASDINAEDLKAINGKIHLSGTSSAKIFVTGNLKANISGIGSITYYGNPKVVSQKITGIGKINHFK